MQQPDSLSPADSELLLLAREDLADPAALVELAGFAGVAGRVDPRGLSLPRSGGCECAGHRGLPRDGDAFEWLAQSLGNSSGSPSAAAFRALVADVRSSLRAPAGLLVAGGAALAAVRRAAGCHEAHMSDVDLFLYGCSEEQAAGVLALLCKHFAGRTVAVRENSFTFYCAASSSSRDPPPVQLIRVVAPTAAAVLHSFDIQAAAVGLDVASGRFLATRQGALAAVHGLAVVDLGRCSRTFEQRLAKYARRGISFVFPQAGRPPRAGDVLGDKDYGELGFHGEGGELRVHLSSHPAVESGPDDDPYGSRRTLGNMAFTKSTDLGYLLSQAAGEAPGMAPAAAARLAARFAGAFPRVCPAEELCPAKEEALLFRRAEGVNVSHRPGVAAADWHGALFNGWEPFGALARPADFWTN